MANPDGSDGTATAEDLLGASALHSQHFAPRHASFRLAASVPYSLLVDPMPNGGIKFVCNAIIDRFFERDDSVH